MEYNHIVMLISGYIRVCFPYSRALIKQSLEFIDELDLLYFIFIVDAVIVLINDFNAGPLGSLLIYTTLLPAMCKRYTAIPILRPVDCY